MIVKHGMTANGHEIYLMAVGKLELDKLLGREMLLCVNPEEDPPKMLLITYEEDPELIQQTFGFALRGEYDLTDEELQK